MVQVRGGASLEIWAQLLWLQNLHPSSYRVDAEFHLWHPFSRRRISGRTNRCASAPPISPTSSSAPLRPERLRPKAQLTNVERALRRRRRRSRRGRPSSTAASERRGCARRPGCAPDPPWSRGATLAPRRRYTHDSSPVPLKGSATSGEWSKLPPDASLLQPEGLTAAAGDAAGALDCPVHAEREAAAKLGAKPIDDGWLRRGGVREIYVATPNASVPSWVAPGDVLVGQLEVDSGEAAVTSLSLGAAAPEEGGGGGRRRRGSRRATTPTTRLQRGAPEGEARTTRRAERGASEGDTRVSSPLLADHRGSPLLPAPRPRAAPPPDGAAEAAWRAEQVETAAGAVGAVDAAALARRTMAARRRRRRG